MIIITATDDEAQKNGKNEKKNHTFPDFQSFWYVCYWPCINWYTVHRLAQYVKIDIHLGYGE